MSVVQRVSRAWRELTKPSRRSSPFAATEITRLTNDWIPSRMPADDEMRWTISIARARARDLERNSAIVKQFLRLVAVNVVGPNGIRLQSQVKNNNSQVNQAFAEKIEAGWEDWCYQPTRDGKMDCVSLQKMIIKTVARDGEAFVRMIRGFSRNKYNFALEMIDPDLIDETINSAKGSGNNAAKGSGTNEIRLGVEVDADGRPVAYHGWDKPPRLVMGAQRQKIRYPADEIIHIYDPERVNQTRGMSWMTSVMIHIRHGSAYSEAELIAARTGASKMGFFQRNAQLGMPGLADDDSDKGQFTMNADPGTFGILPDGYEVASWTPSHPSTAFSEFMKSQLRHIASGLGVTYSALANDLENVNYSSIRAGLLMERDTWRSTQHWWICSFLKPVYKEWLNMSLLSGAIVLDNRDVRKFLDAKWIPRGWAWVDPMKDTQASVLAIGSGLASRTSVLAEQGGDYEDIFSDLANEDEEAAALKINVSVKDLPASPKGMATGGDAGDSGDGSSTGGGRKELINRIAALESRNGHRNGGHS